MRIMEESVCVCACVCSHASRNVSLVLGHLHGGLETEGSWACMGILIETLMKQQKPWGLGQQRDASALSKDSTVEQTPPLRGRERKEDCSDSKTRPLLQERQTKRVWARGPQVS